MLIGSKIGSKTFVDKNRRKAYLKGSKYMARFIKWPGIYFNVKEVKGNELYTFVFSLYTTVDLTARKNRHCQLCKEFHNSFYINEFYNCNTCSLNSFIKREKESLNISVKAFQKRIQGKS